MCEFEEKVKKNLLDCGVRFDTTTKIGAAVSGGADSVSLLISLCNIISEYKLPLYVITVNHNIRPAEESAGDVQYVSELCKKLQEERKIQIFCKVVELKKGLVQSEAQKRGGGIEDAARVLRYKAFEEFIADNSLDALCLAHNKNDQLETVLMRFLQGASLDSAGGIKERRGNFIRPLLNITRSEIEDYLNSQNISWRTDKTNFETDYLRNKIRLKLVPFLNENFEGWQKAVLSGAQKASEDSQVIQSLLSTIPLTENADGGVQLSLDDFMAAPDSIKYRILLDACNKAGETSRIPHQFLKDVISALDTTFIKHFGTIDIIKEKNQLFVKKHSECNTDLVFSAIIEKTGIYEFPFGTLNVFNYREQERKTLVSVCAENGEVVDGVSLPFCVRNISPGDTVMCADGSEKKVSDILSDWHVETSKKSLVPVIQLLDEKSQRIKAVLAGFLGYKDWIVK